MDDGTRDGGIGAERYPDDLLDRLRRVGDAVPDGLVRDLAATGQIDDVNALLRGLIRNGQPVPVALPDEIEQWLRDSATIPAWADRERIERASTFFLEHGVAISLILSTSSLVECYAARSGSKALTCSYRLGHNPSRRIAETAQFVLWIFSPGAFEPDGQAIRAIQKVRLMHSAIRYLIRQTGQWSEDELGVPICQEDMLGALTAFSVLVVRDLRKIGLEISDRDAEDYFHLWMVVGAMLGIDQEQLPNDIAEAYVVARAISRRHHGPSIDGVVLTEAILDFHRSTIPGEVLDGMVPALIRELVGDQIADWMEIPRGRWQSVLDRVSWVGDAWDGTDRVGGPLADAVDRLGMAMLRRRTIAVSGYQGAGFEVPERLADAWAVAGERHGPAPS